MYTRIVPVFPVGTETMLLRTLNQVLPTSSLVVEAAGQRYMQTMQFVYLGELIDANADIMPGIKRRIRLAWACYDRFKRELYDMEDATLMLKVRLLKTEVMETLPYGCVTWALGLEHFTKLLTAQHNLLRISGFQHRQRTDHRMSYAKALKNA